MFQLFQKTPITEDEHKQADEKYRQVSIEQKARLNSIADKVAIGEQLSSRDAEVVVAVLRAKADAISEERPKGRTLKIPPEVAHFCALDVFHGKRKKTKAIEHYAEVYCVSIEAIKDVLKREDYDAILGRLKNGGLR